MYIIFLICSCYLFYQAYRFMSLGWQTQEAGPVKVKVEEKTKQITRPPHPEMADVKPGDVAASPLNPICWPVKDKS